MAISRIDKKRPRILFLTKYPRRGPSSRYRALQYIPFIERAGFDCAIQSLHTDSYFDALFGGRSFPATYIAGRAISRTRAILGAGRYDAVFIQKEIFPYMPAVAEGMLRILGCKIIYDIDDSYVYLYYSGSSNPLVRFFLGRKIPSFMRAAEVVLCGNSFLRAYAAEYNPGALLFPTVVDPSLYAGAAGSGGSGSPVIGWIGSPETSFFLQELGDVLKQLSSSLSFGLRVIGDMDFSLPGLEVETVPWSEESEAELLAGCDIGIMPLPDTPVARGKCGLKLLQYMASGLPVVSSPAGGASEIIEDGVNGFLAHGEGEWIGNLTRLLGDPDLRSRIGAAGRRRVEKQYSLDVWAPRMVAVIERVIAGETLEEPPW
jgi:glycosyltransferase involved in cell wall biosynthesis